MKYTLFVSMLFLLNCQSQSPKPQQDDSQELGMKEFEGMQGRKCLFFLQEIKHLRLSFLQIPVVV
jgi:hypothetical protein